jgi:hypothetical protein
MKWTMNNSNVSSSTRPRSNNLVAQPLQPSQPPQPLQRQRSVSAPNLSSSAAASSSNKKRRGSNSVLPTPINAEKKKQAKIDLEKELSLLDKYVTSFNKVVKAIICNQTNGYFCTKFKNAYIQTPALIQEDTIDGAVTYINKITGSIKYTLGNIYTYYKRINPEMFVSPSEFDPVIINIEQLEEKLDAFNKLLNGTTCKIKDGFFCKKLTTNSYPENGVAHNEHVGSAIEYLKFQLDQLQKSVQQYKTQSNASSASVSGGKHRRNIRRSMKKVMRKTQKRHTKRRHH